MKLRTMQVPSSKMTMPSGGKHELEYLAKAKPSMLRVQNVKMLIPDSPCHLPVATYAGDGVEVDKDETSTQPHDVARLSGKLQKRINLLVFHVKRDMTP